MTTTETLQIEKRQRGPFGWIVAIVFWGFNTIMIYYIFSVFDVGADYYSNASDGADQAGFALGTGFAIYILGSIWFTGTIILGIMMVLTRGKKIISTKAVSQ